MKYVDELKEHISGYNFNKYYQPPNSPHPSISMRFNTDDPELIQKIVIRLSKKLLEVGEIRSYDKELHDWVEPDFVVKAHELGTLCAITFRNLERNAQLYQKFMGKPAEFTAFFVYALLSGVGYNIPIIWSLLRLSPIVESELGNIIDQSTDIFHENLEEIEITSDFMERFVHAFFNCTYSPAETMFKGWVAESQLWKNIVES